MEKTVTISISTFVSLLHLAKHAQGSCGEYAENSAKKLEQSPNDYFWQESVNFWQAEAQSAENTYKKALQEAIYS